MISQEYYGTLQEATDYFGNRLHERAWSLALVADRPKALLSATLVIDTLNFKGYKAPVFALLKSRGLTDVPHAPAVTFGLNSFSSLAVSLDEIRAAEDSQVLEFPRGADTQVPEAIRRACYEIAHSLLDGRDPESELEALGVVSQGYSSVRTTYSRTQLPIEHLINGIPNALAWRLLRPFLRDEDAIKLSRVS
jgi:hypothetical protein